MKADLLQNRDYRQVPLPSTAPDDVSDALQVEDLQIDLGQTDLGQGSPAGKGPPAAGRRIGPFSASVPRGGYHIITGPNGAGKSALVGVIALATPPAAGRFWILGHEIAGSRSGPRSRPGSPAGGSDDRAVRKAIRRRIGAVFQHLSPLPGATVMDTVLLPVSLAGATDTERRGAEDPAAAARELLHWVGLSGRDHDMADSLSGGETRCLALARALIRRPEILIADDPTRGLDERAAWRMMGLIEQLHRQGTTIIVATNDPAFVQSQSHPMTDLGGRRNRTVSSAKSFAESPAESFAGA